MRIAQALKYWQKVYKRNYNLKLEQIDFHNVPGIGSGTVCFRGGITVVCGGNGVGKTTLFESILGAFDYTRIVRFPVSKTRLGNSSLSLKLSMDNNVVNASSIFIDGDFLSDVPENIPVFWVDPSLESSRLVKFFGGMKNLGELLEPLSPRELTLDELQSISYIVGKEYDYCEIYEIDEFDDEAVMPYFRVSSNGISYGSETMGFGELSLHLILWNLRRLSSGSILLIEEPETHVSPRSQWALMDVIAKYSLESGAWIILTTHSPGIITRVPIEHVRLLYRQGAQVSIIDKPSRQQLLSILGVTAQYSGVLLVEDSAAHDFLKAWINYHDPTLLRSFEIGVAGSDGDIVAALEKFPRIGPWLKIVGVFDGDMRDKKGTYNWPYSFLPGDAAPEILFRASIRSNVNMFVSRIARNQEEVRLILSELEGFDHHDWLIELGRRLNLPIEGLIEDLFLVWIQEEGNKSLSQASFDELLLLLN